MFYTHPGDFFQWFSGGNPIRLIQRGADPLHISGGGGLTNSRRKSREDFRGEGPLERGPGRGIRFGEGVATTSGKGDRNQIRGRGRPRARRRPPVRFDDAGGLRLVRDDLGRHRASAAAGVQILYMLYIFPFLFSKHCGPSCHYPSTHPQDDVFVND